MAVTVITEGPIDKLNKGILAGAKFAALASGIRTQETRNQHDAQRLLFEEANSQSLTGMRKAQAEESAMRNELIQAQINAGTPAANAALAQAKTSELKGEERREFISSLLDVSRDITNEDIIAASTSVMARFEIEPTFPNMEIAIGQVKGMHSQMKAKQDAVNERTEAIALANVNRTAGSMPFAIQQWYVGQQTGLKAALSEAKDAQEFATRTRSRPDGAANQKIADKAEAKAQKFQDTLSDAIGQYFNSRQENNVIPQQEPRSEIDRGTPSQVFTVGQQVQSENGLVEFLGGDHTKQENWRRVN